MKVNRYLFDSIVGKTKRNVSPIRRGQEDNLYFDTLALLEIQIYQFHTQYGIHGRQIKEILQLVLFDIKSITEKEDYDCSNFMEQYYRECADSIGQFFFPQKNPNLKMLLREPLAEDDDFFEFARKHIIRIHESVEQWTNDFGPSGYFNFISNYIDSEIKTTKKFLVEDRFFRE